MKTSLFRRRPNRAGFTLIEMMVVMAIIVVLASLTFAGFNIMKRKARFARVQGELARIETAIESYKQALGFYPPDSALVPQVPAVAQLFYELSGTVIRVANSQTNYQTVDGNETIPVNLIKTYFGREGFANASADKTQIRNFLGAVKESQYKEAFTGVDVELLVAPVEGPVLAAVPGLAPWKADAERVNPFHYVSTKPAHRPGEFDLWVDIRVGGKVYRISNWAEPTLIAP